LCVSATQEARKAISTGATLFEKVESVVGIYLASISIIFSRHARDDEMKQ
jgi:hypothetical protein